jgi:hypothetical protein
VKARASLRSEQAAPRLPGRPHLGTPPRQERSGRWERVALGTYLLGCYMLAVSLLVSFPFETAGWTVEPDHVLARQIQVVAAMTIAGAVVLAVHHLGVLPGLKMILHEAWPGLLGGAAVGFITGAPLRAFVPADAFWLVLAPVYLVGIVAICWLALRAPPGESAQHQRWED